MNYQQQYRDTFGTFGFALTEEHALPEAEVKAGEARLGVRLPRSLRDYYLIAGNERRFNTAHNRLLMPGDWHLEDGKLIFMEENQAVVLWGTPIQPEQGENRDDRLDDPAVYQGVNGNQIEWHPEQERCSEFLQVMLHLQGVWGAMPWAAEAEVSAEEVSQVRAKLDQHWTFAGATNGMRAYHRPGQAACLLAWDEAFKLFAGAAVEPGETVEPDESDGDDVIADIDLEWEEADE